MVKIRSIGKLAASLYCAAAALAVLVGSEGELRAAAPTPVVSQAPLSMAGSVPGNLLLTPSVEFPTINSVANLGAYTVGRAYAGYFDPHKCYQYSWSANEPDRHFYPVSVTANRTCSGAWSGNFLNWAVTQTIDPFRKALTGGYRVRDTTTETWLEKAWSDNQSSAAYFPNTSITSAISSSTPATWTGGGSGFYMRVSRLGNKMHFARLDNLVGQPTDAPAAAVPYQGGVTHPLSGNSNTTVHELSIRVKVCVAGLLEANCEPYGANYKPEGLIQKYRERIRYSAFGYLNDHSGTRDGGVLRARQKFVGPHVVSFDATDGWVTSNNPNREWDPDTGVFIQNPDPVDASATSSIIGDAGYAIQNSGVINYINKFGQVTGQPHKTYDPVSELYYTAIRYLKSQGNVPEYTSLTGAAQTRYHHADGFPVITDWNDPIQYTCQNNAILGIGDVFTHRDKNLPGSGTSGTDEPTKPSAVSGDSTVNVRTATEKVAQLQGLTIDTAADSWSGRSNSAFIAGLAYDSHTVDMRPLLAGKQTVSTYWVDVREEQTLLPPSSNPYWLAAKFGGFRVPEDFNPYTATTLPIDSWESAESLTPSNGVAYPRPENFYVASEADKMVEGLSRAFAQIVAESKGSASSLAANSTRLDTETRTFQAQFSSGIWSGELNSWAVTSSGELSASPLWSASVDMLSGGGGTALTPATRNILAGNDAGTGLVNFTTGGLSAAQKTALGGASTTRQADVISYLRGDRSKEESAAGGYLRVRDGILGDIVNSTPLFIGAPNARAHAGASYAGGDSYAAFATAQAVRTPVVYVGANDGMLHAFNAANGREVFGFVPNSAIANGLDQYASPDYEHRYFVDGETAAADIHDARNGGNWKTVLVGSLGRGGPGIFALDVTAPGSPELLWEKNGTSVTGLGRNIGRPVIAQVADGHWRVLLGNGPDSSDGVARLVSIRLGSSSNGDVTTYSPSAATGNGLTALLVRDSDADGFADTAYAGDLLGNLWKFTGLGGTISSVKLFQARDPDGNPQPITAAPMVGRDPSTGQLWVFFGTGQYLNQDDLADDQVQSWYGIKDTGALITDRNALVERSILEESTIGGFAARVIEPGSVADMAGMQGWYIDLVSPGMNGAQGERMVVQNRFQGVALVGTTRIPEYDDPCGPGGRGFVMAIDPFTGARLVNNFFDMNSDGISNDSDKYCDGSGKCVPVSGIGFESSPNNPIFIENVMQVGLDDGGTEAVQTFGSSVEAGRLSWRELINN
jgi:type IV pilus assembly protein PilY1